jgi:hypothetical protein
MKKKEAIDKPLKYGCEFCKREFARETTLISHICEYKHRWLEKDKKSNRIAFQAWVQFYSKTSLSKTKYKTYEEFIKSMYYNAFAKFGAYCADANVINPSRYVDWLLRDNIKIDTWNSDKVYTRFLCEYLRSEDPFDAIHRSVEFCMEASENEKTQIHDYLRFGNKNKICYAITTGKISPWMLYQSTSGIQFLDTLNPDHVTMILDYINPEQWTLKFKRDPDTARQIKEVLTAGGY